MGGYAKRPSNRIEAYVIDGLVRHCAVELFGHLYSQQSSTCGFSLNSGYEESDAGSSERACELRISVFPDRWRAR